MEALVMQNWSISLSEMKRVSFSSGKHDLVEFHNFMSDPRTALAEAPLQKFAKITPQYPGIRAPLPESVSLAWLETLSPVLDKVFGEAANGWEVQAWFSIVTSRPEELLPLQRFPHVDGTDPRQLALMLYLHSTEHGGTGFFRHKSTQFEDLTNVTFPAYREALQHDVGRSGMPPAQYITDGEPYFERTFQSKGGFNQAILYRGNLLHSGLIDERANLSSDPIKGRLTINAFFRPTQTA